jgi:hypothetical protein
LTWTWAADRVQTDLLILDDWGLAPLSDRERPIGARASH